MIGCLGRAGIVSRSAHAELPESARCSHGQPLEVATEAQSGEPLGPGHISRWGQSWDWHQSPHAGSGRKAKAGGTRVEIGRAAPGQRTRLPAWESQAGLPSVPLPPLRTWSPEPELWAGAASARQRFHHPLPGPGEPVGAQQGCPARRVRARALGKDHTPGPPSPASATPTRQGRLHL